MKQGQILARIYREIYGSNFDKNNPDNCELMQKAVYMLSQLAISLGDYGFNFINGQPYSLEIAYTIGNEKFLSNDFQLSEEVKKAIEKIKKILNVSHEGYSLVFWVRAVTSLHYMDKYKYQLATKTGLLNKLVQLNVNLINLKLNAKAYGQIKFLTW